MYYCNDGQKFTGRFIGGYPTKAVLEYRRDWLTNTDLKVMMMIEENGNKSVTPTELFRKMTRRHGSCIPVSTLQNIFKKLDSENLISYGDCKTERGATVKGIKLIKYALAIVEAEKEGIYADPKWGLRAKWGKPGKRILRFDQSKK